MDFSVYLFNLILQSADYVYFYMNLNLRNLLYVI